MKYVKNLLPALLLAVGLYGCATIPKQRAATDALIIGNLVLDFPDGFLGQRARTVRSNIYLYFEDTTTGARFGRLANDGFFSFRGNGSDQYVLERYEYNSYDMNEGFDLNDRIRLSFSSVPGKIVNLGNLVIRYEKPNRTYRTTFARSTSFEDDGFGRLHKGFLLLHQDQTYWQYTRTDDRQWDDAAVIAYIKKKNPDSPWLQSEIVDLH